MLQIESMDAWLVANKVLNSHLGLCQRPKPSVPPVKQKQVKQAHRSKRSAIQVRQACGRIAGRGRHCFQTPNALPGTTKQVRASRLQLSVTTRGDVVNTVVFICFCLPISKDYRDSMYADSMEFDVNIHVAPSYVKKQVPRKIIDPYLASKSHVLLQCLRESKPLSSDLSFSDVLSSNGSTIEGSGISNDDSDESQWSFREMFNRGCTIGQACKHQPSMVVEPKVSGHVPKRLHRWPSPPKVTRRMVQAFNLASKQPPKTIRVRAKDVPEWEE